MVLLCSIWHLKLNCQPLSQGHASAKEAAGKALLHPDCIPQTCFTVAFRVAQHLNLFNQGRRPQVKKVPTVFQQLHIRYSGMVGTCSKSNRQVQARFQLPKDNLAVQLCGIVGCGSFAPVSSHPCSFVGDLSDACHPVFLRRGSPGSKAA